MDSSRTIHKSAAEGYSRAAEVYEKARPSYPAEALDFLSEKFALASAKVVEVGAGTGKFSRLLAARGAHLIAIEPVAAMRAEFTKNVAGVPILAGSAENIPVKDGGVDVVIAAQAFHWFNAAAALEEFARILRPQGAVVLVWNQRDEASDWSRKLTEIVTAYQEDSPSYRSGAWKLAFEGNSKFTALEHRRFVNQQTGPLEMLAERATSISFIAALPEDEKSRVVERVRELARTHPDLRGKAEIVWKYQTNIYWCRKK